MVPCGNFLFCCTPVYPVLFYVASDGPALCLSEVYVDGDGGSSLVQLEDFFNPQSDTQISSFYPYFSHSLTRIIYLFLTHKTSSFLYICIWHFPTQICTCAQVSHPVCISCASFCQSHVHTQTRDSFSVTRYLCQQCLMMEEKNVDGHRILKDCLYLHIRHLLKSMMCIDFFFYSRV